MRERFEHRLLNHVFDVRIVAHLRVNKPPKDLKVGFD
jgi:hypothetical protein